MDRLVKGDIIEEVFEFIGLFVQAAFDDLSLELRW